MGGVLNVRSSRVLCIALLLILALALVVTPVSAAPTIVGSDTEVSVGSPSFPFSQNKQNEPGVAIDMNPAADGRVVVAGANENIDMEGCNAGDPTTCPFTPGVGVTGVYFSFDGGSSWMQPTYQGWSARHCLGPAACVPRVGPIGTLPNYFENDMVSNGDPIMAFGPQPDANGNFSWANGSRLYFSNIVTNFPGREGFQGQGAIGVSRIDGNPTLTPTIVANQSNWMDPVIVTKQSSAIFNDKEAVWADNTSASPHFGNAYVCNVAFRSLGGAPEPVVFARSTDGGDTWQTQQITQAANTGNTTGRSGGRQGCTVRTDSDGVVYVFFNGSQSGQDAQMLTRSFDGGVSFEKPFPVAAITEVGAFDPVQGRFSFDGLAGARTNSFPSVDIANGAPSGTGDTIVLLWPDARNGLNNEEALIQFSTDKGVTWSTPVNAAAGTSAQNGSSPAHNDRPDFPAVAVSPDGTDVYVTYMGFIDPFRRTTSTTRRFSGVVRFASLGPSGFSSFRTLRRGPLGDGRGSSANGLTSEFLGDYNYAAANNAFGVAVWIDDRNAAVCTAINRFRQALIDGTTATPPAPTNDCGGPTNTFGNTDIFGGAYADPTP
jgi:hypothetical protein